MTCPGCNSGEMASETYAGNYGSTVEIDVCHHCNGIWFDGRESLQLAPGSTIKLFQSMHERQSQARAALLEQMACPRCSGALKISNDRVRNTAFTYFHCAQHGRYITFFQWLREKGLVRAPNPKELLDLKARVKVVNCSNCGAPVSLEKETNCSHCQAPVSILAPEAVEKALVQLKQQEIDRATIKPEKIVEAMMVKEQINSQHRAQQMVDAFTGVASGGGWGGDLVGLGVGLLLEALFS